MAAVGWLLFKRKRIPKGTTSEVPPKWKLILMEKVLFYKNLDESGRDRFEQDVINFLNHVKVVGVQTDVTLEDRLLVASSAIIPLFGFPVWTYSHLDEVLLYPSSFDRNFNIGSKEEVITGMVGNGAMEGKVILSKPSLHSGFAITSDKRNVGIHEFVHLFDKEDGIIDGIPPGLEGKEYALAWLTFIHTKTQDIIENKSDIDDYAAYNRKEFFAVASEYFFERPHLLERKHPKLYQQLAKVFNQQLVEVIDPSVTIQKVEPGRNQKCPCGSGLKYKRCCMM